jgi:hypothetical protein
VPFATAAAFDPLFFVVDKRAMGLLLLGGARSGRVSNVKFCGSPPSAARLVSLVTHSECSLSLEQLARSIFSTV